MQLHFVLLTLSIVLGSASSLISTALFAWIGESLLNRFDIDSDLLANLLTSGVVGVWALCTFGLFIHMTNGQDVVTTCGRLCIIVLGSLAGFGFSAALFRILTPEEARSR